MPTLPFSQACENNQPHILEHLQTFFADVQTVLEVGSGTGQHACYFAQHMPWLLWQPTDVPENLATLRPRCAAYTGNNLLPPDALDVTDRPWPLAIPDALFTANSLHIMPYSSVEALFDILQASPTAPQKLAIYGPFNYGGQYTSESNARFDVWLAQQHPHSAIRDFEAIEHCAHAAGFILDEDVAMPANNRLLLWRRTDSGSTRKNGQQV